VVEAPTCDPVEPVRETAPLDLEHVPVMVGQNERRPAWRHGGHGQQCLVKVGVHDVRPELLEPPSEPSQRGRHIDEP
jgi:hypothetical protein